MGSVTRINSLIEINGEGTYGVSLPRDDLRLAEVVNDGGQLLEEDQQVIIENEGRGEWRIRLADV